MSNLLKGNFTTKNSVTAATMEEDTLEQKFEKEALKKLGGSVSYIAKEKIVWDLDEDNAKK